MHDLTIQSRRHLAALTDAIVVAEKTLASMPASRHSSCVFELDEHAYYFRDDPSDPVCLRFGQISRHPGECVYIELSDELNEVYYTSWIGDEIIPVPIRVAVASQIPRLLRLAATDAGEDDSGRVGEIAIAIERATAAIRESGNGCQVTRC